MKLLKKTLVILLGGSVLVIGLAMLVLPGPAFVVIPTALAILAVEFVWARRWLAWLRERVKVLVAGKTADGQPPNRVIADSYKSTSQTS